MAILLYRLWGMKNTQNTVGVIAPNPRTSRPPPIRRNAITLSMVEQLNFLILTNRIHADFKILLQIFLGLLNACTRGANL